MSTETLTRVSWCTWKRSHTTIDVGGFKVLQTNTMTGSDQHETWYASRSSIRIARWVCTVNGTSTRVR